MADAKPGFLRNLRIKRVALVPMGANFDRKTGDGAHIMLYKAAPSVDSLHVPALIGADDYETEYEKSNLDAQSRNALPDSAFAAVWTDSAGKKHRKLPIHDAGHLAAARGRIAQADIPASVKAEAQRKIDAKTHNKEKSMSKIAKMFKAFTEIIKETDPAKQAAALEQVEKEFPDDLEKAIPHDADDDMCKCADCMMKRKQKSAEVPAELQKSFDVLKAENAQLKKSVDDALAISKAERTARVTSEVTAILKSFRATPIKLTGDDSDIPRFLKMYENDRATFDRTIEIMKATDEAAAASGLFNNVGSGHGGGGGDEATRLYAQLEAQADALLEKSADGKLTHEVAMEKVLLMPKNAKLVTQYNKAAKQ